MTTYICNTCLLSPTITSLEIDLINDNFTIRYDTEIFTSVYVRNNNNIYVQDVGTFVISHFRISGFVNHSDFSGYIYGDINGKPSDLVTPYSYYCRIEPHDDFQLTFSYNTINLTNHGILTTTDFETYGEDLIITFLTSTSVAGIYQGNVFTGSTIFDPSEMLTADEVTINGSHLGSSKYVITSHYNNISELEMSMSVPKSMINFDIHQREQDLIQRLDNLSNDNSMYWTKSSNHNVDYYEILDNNYDYMFTIYKVMSA
jgi:hypothetical protein